MKKTAANGSNKKPAADLVRSSESSPIPGERERGVEQVPSTIGLITIGGLGIPS